jgi:putative PIN family toxin of toxin-antitoxin system
VEKDGVLPRLVIDTNVFVSGLISGDGPPGQILRALQSQRAIHLVSDPIVEEYLRVLDYPRIRKFRKISDPFVADIAAYLVYQTERVELRSQLRMNPDPDDDVFLNTAVDGRAALLVSGDKTDLLALRRVDSIPIVSAREAVERINNWAYRVNPL